MTGAGITTIMFTDVVRSTALLQQVGDERARSVLARHRERLVAALAAHGGEELQWLGDGVMAAFDSVADGVRCAIAMQALAGEAEGDGLLIRIGVNVGEILRDDEGAGFFGTPVVTARRLCDRASAGRILCTSTVAELLAGRHAFRFHDLGEMALKGLAEPVRVCEILHDGVGAAPRVDAAPAAPPVPPLPPLLAPTAQFPLAGRRRELDLVLGAWRETTRGSRRVVILEGEPGIGKSRLASEAARHIHGAGGIVLFGRCDEGLGVPFQPFAEAFEHFVAHTPDELLPARLGRHAGDLVRLAPDLALRVPGLPPPLRSEPELERYRLFDAVAGWIAAAAADHPLALVLDDLHWAAKPTLFLLRHVARTVEHAPVLIVGTHRDTEVGRDHPLVELLADLQAVHGLERLALRGLDEGEVVEFLEQASGQRLDVDGHGLARAVHLETAGNPFFVGEVLRHLAESGAIVRRDGRWTSQLAVSDMGLTAAVRDVVVRRVTRLSPAAADTLTLAAVIGRDFHLATLAALGRLDEDALLAALDAAVAARLVDEVGVDSYRFAHALVRAALYKTLSASRRARLHRRVAEALVARRPDDVTALAYHFAEAGPALRDRAIDYTVRAADQAAARLAHDQSADLYARALALLDEGGAGDDARRCDLAIRLGVTQKHAGDPAYRRTLLDAAACARDLGDAERFAEAALANNRGWASTTGAVDDERVAMLEGALAALPEADSASRARLLATLAAELLYAPQTRARRVALSDAALAMARRADDPATLTHVLNARSHAIWGPENLAERLANTAEHVAVAERLGDPLTLWYACATRAQTCMEAAELGEVDRHLATLGTLTAELPLPHQRWAATIAHAWRALLRGGLDDAERLATEAFEIGAAAGQRDALGYYAGQLLAVRWDQGRLAELVPVIEQAALRHRGLPAFRAALALAYCDAGRLDDARAISDEAAADGFADVPIDMVWTTAMASHAEVAVRLGATATATMLYERLAPWAGFVVFNPLYVFGAVSRSLALLATVLDRPRDADRHFADAVALFERLDAPVWLARTRVDWAQALLARPAGAPRDGAVPAPGVLLDDAVAACRRGGYAAVERAAAALGAAA